MVVQENESIFMSEEPWSLHRGGDILNTNGQRASKEEVVSQVQKGACAGVWRVWNKGRKVRPGP